MFRRLALLVISLAACLPASAFAQAPPAKPRTYRLLAVDLKQPIIWGSICETEDGLGLAFGGQDQTSEDGVPPTRIKVEGKWVSIREELEKKNPFQEFVVPLTEIRAETRAVLASLRRLYLQGHSQAELQRRITAEIYPRQARLLARFQSLQASSQDLIPPLTPTEATRNAEAAPSRNGGSMRLRFDMNQTAAELRDAHRTLEVGGIAAIRSLQRASDFLLQTIAGCSAAPLPRALSPLVFEPKSRRFFLFGGDHGDFLHADLWCFDPQTRGWSQRSRGPSPRANHALIATGDGKLVVRGGYEYSSSTSYLGGPYHDVADAEWVYDVEQDQWTGQASNGRAASAYRTGPYHPDFFLQEPAPDAAATAAALAAIQPNAWVEQQPPHRPEVDRAWGHAVLDVDRDMILVWCGGHSSHGGTDVLHYHLGSNRWELCYPVELPLGQTYVNSNYPEGFNFNRRPWVTGHTYQSYAYDPLSKLMYFNGRRAHTYVYDPALGDWTGRFEKPPAMSYGSGYYTLNTLATPTGLVCWTARRELFRLDAKARQWTPIEVREGQVPESVVDASTYLYDAKRDRLIFFSVPYGKPSDGQVYAFNFTTGTAQSLEPVNRAALAEAQVRQLDRGCYLPGEDLILFASILPESNPPRTVAYDCAANRWVTLGLAYAVDANGKLANPRGGGHSCGLMFDAKRRLIWGMNTLERRVFALQLDRQTADLRPL